MLSFFEKIRSFSLKEIVSLRKKSNENILILISYKKKWLKDLKHHILSKDSKNSNLKSIDLVAQQSLKKKVVIDGKECTVRYDIENYITSLQGQAVKALTDLKIYQDVNFKHQVDHLICKGDVFQALKIELTKGGTPRLKLPNGYVTANNRFVELTTDSPLVSLIVPIYNVEKYLEECLISLKNQTYKNIEVVLVNDGSPDNSVLIAEKIIEEDKRFKLYSQKNAGLSAARNKGIELSSGQFVWFIDSDDIIPENAVKIMIDSLLKTGSDFAVGCYRRFNSQGYKKPPHWISNLHLESHQNTKLENIPDVLANTIACSKVINLQFLLKNKLYFKVGVLYEDQIWSPKLYRTARSFDIVKDIIYDWRVREDNSSITQQAHDVKHLDAIFNALQIVINDFYESELEIIAHERIVQFLSNNMREYIAEIEHTDLSYLDCLSTGLINITKNLPISKWKDVPAHIASIEWLLLQKKYENIYMSIEQGVRNTSKLVAIYYKNELILKVPFWNDPSINFPIEVLMLKENQFNPNVEVRKAYWEMDKLYLEGWAYLPLVNPIEVKPTKIQLISDESEPHIVELDVENFIHPELNRVCKHHINNYENFGFRAWINFNEINLRSSQNYKILFILSVGSIVRKIELSKVINWGGASHVQPKNITGGKCIRFISNSRNPALINIQQKEVLIRDIKIENKSIFIKIKSSLKLNNFQVVELNDKKNINNIHSFPLKFIGSDEYECNIDNFSFFEGEHWLIRVIGKNGKLYVVDSNNIGLPLLIKSDKNNFKLDLFQTNYGNLGLIKSNPKIIVTNILEVKDGIKIVANFHSDKVKNLNAKILDHRNIIDCKVKYLRDNKFTITIPYKLYQWGESRFLPSGRYELEVYKDSTKVELIFNQASMSDLPLSLSSHAPIVGNLEYKFRKKSLSLVVYPTIKLERQGERIRHENINKHKSENLKIDENAVFFRTYFGESTTCNALAIHNELIKRGTNLKMYWSVKDSSIKVPQDGIPVVEGSDKWFELYSTAKVIIDNMHQPEFFQKKNGQIVIATFHGYPFKSAGMPFWIKQGFSKKQIDLFLYRQSQWDYLVSPSPYATPILKEVFPSNASILEIGYPRNDIFFSDKKENIRQKTRNSLNIPFGKKVILYAPTFRDNLATSDSKAKINNFLDFEKILKEVKDDYILLIRGHAFNARLDERLEINSNKIIDVTDYPEISDLCIASDVAILDYS